MKKDQQQSNHPGKKSYCSGFSDQSDDSDGIFFFDDAKIVSRKGMYFSGPDMKKQGKVFAGEETYYTVFCCSVLTPAETGSNWRMYYLDESNSGQQNRRIITRYAESSDGNSWDRNPADRDGKLSFNGLPPEAECRLASVIPPTNGDSWRLFGWVFAPGGCIRFLTFSSDDGVEWNCLNFDNPCLLHPNDLEAGGERGFDGLTPGFEFVKGDKTASMSELYAKRRLLSNDATAVYRLPDGRFEMYSIWLADNPVNGKNYCAYDNAPTICRVIQKRYSDDGIRWSDPQVNITPDAEDPDMMQFYYLAVTRYRNWTLGLLGDYPCEKQIIEPEFVISRDQGNNWQRPFRSQPWIKAEGEDSGAFLIHPARTMVDAGDHWKIFYNSSYFRHNNFMQEKPQPRKRDLKLAKIPKKRLMGLSGSGIIETAPLFLKGGDLFLDANITGSVRYELLDINGNPMAGCTANDCLELRGDSTRHTLKWETGKHRELVWRIASIRFHVDRGTMFFLEP